jgi:hypothetical protein
LFPIGGGLASGAKNPHGAFFPFTTKFNVEGDEFVESWASAILRESGYVDEYLASALSGRNEPESSVVVPFRESAMVSHWTVKLKWNPKMVWFG